MGKYILLITLGVSAALSMYAGQFQSAQVDARSELAERQKLIIARQMARSAYASGVSEVKRQLNVSLNQCEQLEGGTFELTTRPLSGDTVQVRAVGRYGGDGCSCTECPQYAISGEATLEPNGSFSALTFDGSLASANLSGGGKGPVISGNDAAGKQDRNGVSLSESGDRATMRNEFCGRSGSDVQGIGGDCDVVHDPGINIKPLDAELSDLVQNEATHKESDLCGGGKGRGRKGKRKGPGGGPVGSSESLAVVNVEGDCRLSGNSGGMGIIYVDGGSLTMTGNSEWKGMVFVTGEGSFKASKGTPNISGSVAFYDGGSLDMRGTASIQYNSDQMRRLREEFGIDALKELIDSPAGDAVRMTNRSQGAVGPGEAPAGQGRGGAQN
ncbi:hypothetical protein GGP84_000878 [Salinibacter ruber]|uniref:hypothetical protein n=1 Tax=Salinibacter ruber TaxID=146919 RepID=UPI00216A15EB|nr:hypothetical protein [Salinibacter ruber]MCS3938263.1 hypothetical protein [Salinibacter ruber]